MTDTPFVSIEFDMPPEELRKHVAALISIGLYRARLPYIPGDKIKASDFEDVANFVIGGLLGMQQAKNKGN